MRLGDRTYTPKDVNDWFRVVVKGLAKKCEPPKDTKYTKVLDHPVKPSYRYSKKPSRS